MIKQLFTFVVYYLLNSPFLPSDLHFEILVVLHLGDRLVLKLIDP